jgi:hypothetical protein
MTQPPAPPSVIPYVEHHTGARRTLLLHLTTGNAIVRAKIPPIVGIDGRSYVVYWGPVTFEIPADRAVHVSVHCEGDAIVQAASALLPPGESLTLTYATDHLTGRGTLQ